MTVHQPKKRRHGVYFFSQPMRRRLMVTSSITQLSANDVSIIRQTLLTLTSKQAQLLEAVADIHEGEAVSRADLVEDFASRLYDHDIRVLNGMVEIGLLVEYKQGRVFFYRVPPGVLAVLYDERKEPHSEVFSPPPPASDPFASLRPSAARPAPVQAAPASVKPPPALGFTSTIVRVDDTQNVYEEPAEDRGLLRKLLNR